jgi:hypothetical protein
MTIFTGRTWRIFLLTLLPIVQSCSYIGPNSVENDRRNYNDVLQETNNEEILLNLVRMKYIDTPSFVNINSITSQLSFSASTSLSVTKTVTDSIKSLSKTIIPSFSVTDSPVISYSPLQGDEYIRELLTPFSSTLVTLLVSSGSPLNTVLKMSVTRMNDVWNAPDASRPYPKMAPQFEQFDELIVNLDLLGKNVQLGYSVVDKQSLPTLRFEPGALATSPGKNIVRILNLAPGIDEFVLNSGDWVKKKNVINVQTRSLMGMFYLLSHSVSVPPEHEKLGWVGKTLNADGSPFDWARITKDLFVINVSSEKPSDADIMIKYRGKWFSVARNDLSSKKTFNIISQLLALQSGTIHLKPPALTIPLN